MPEHTELEIDSIISRQNVAKEGWTTYYVDGATGNDAANFLRWETAAKTIQAAIDKAESWAKIYIAAGTYPENVIINKDKIRLKGVRKNTVIISPTTGYAIVGSANHCIIESITPKCNQAGQYDIRITGDDNLIQHCLLDAGAAGVYGCRLEGDYNKITKSQTTVDVGTAFNVLGLYCEVSHCLADDNGFGVSLSAGCEFAKIFENNILNCNGAGYGIGTSAGSAYNSIFHNNLINNTNQVLGGGTENEFFENFYDDHIVDTNNSGLCDTSYTFTNGVDYTPISKRYGWEQRSLGVTNSMVNVIEMLNHPLLYLYEGWQNEAGIDPTVWAITDPAGGLAWDKGASLGYLRAYTTPVADNTARLRTKQQWIAAPDTYDANTILRKQTCEFELKLDSVANLDNALTFFGLTETTGANRGTNHILGWGLSSDVLESITDDAGSETTNTGFGETLTNWNKLKMEIYEGHVKFYIDEVEKADHITDLPDTPAYLNFFIDTEGTGAASFNLGVVRIWMEDFKR